MNSSNEEPCDIILGTFRPCAGPLVDNEYSELDSSPHSGKVAQTRACFLGMVANGDMNCLNLFSIELTNKRAE